jgi:hypothetical protein
MKKDAYYFPHFCNARNDRKLRRVRKQLGIEGYGIYFLILEVLREQKDFKYPIMDIDLLADEFGTSEQKISAVVHNYDLFNIDNNNNFFSIKFIEFLTPYLERKEQKRVAGIKGNLIKHGYATKEELKDFTHEQIIDFNNNIKNLALRPHSENTPTRAASQKKRKESKVKEIYIDPHIFYNQEIEENKDKNEIEKYIRFYGILKGENDLNEELTNVINLKSQVTYQQFEKLLSKSIEKKKKFINMLYDMYNNKKYTKNKVSLYLILNSWLNKE